MRKTKTLFWVGMLAATCLTRPAYAGNFYVFGDSLSDNGNTIKFGVPYPPPPYDDYRFSNGPVWAEYFPALTGLGFTADNDYAVGGAFAGPLTLAGTAYNNLENLPTSISGSATIPVPLPSFLEEVSEFAATGAHFGSSDVVSVWVGANEYFATLEAIASGNATAADIPDVVQSVATQTAQGIAELNALGAQRFLVFNLPDLGSTPAFNQDGAATIAEVDAITAAHNQTLADYMESEHVTTGANILLVNEQQLFQEVLANPAAYGKTNVTAACIDTPACVTASTAVQNQYLFWDTVHPTTGSHLIIAEYAANELNALAGLAAPAQLAAAGADAFTGALNQRLEALRAGATGFAIDIPGQGMSGTLAPGKLSGFFTAGYSFGTRATLGADNGFSYDIGNFALGVDDQLAPGIAAGAAIGYATLHGSITADGSMAASAYQLGAYASFYQPGFYLNLEGSYGFDDFNNSRPGVISGITAKPTGNTASFGGEIGAPLHFGAFTAGPVAGVTVTNAALASYTERGDPALTQAAGAQTYFAAIGDAGATAATTLALGGLALTPHLTATVDHLFSGNGGNFTSVFTDEPAVSLTTTYPDQTKTWAEFSGGVAAALNARLSLNADFATTAGRSSGEDHEFSGALRYSF